MPYRELSELPLTLLERTLLRWLHRGLQGEHPYLTDERRTEVERMIDVRIGTSDPGLTRVHEKRFWRLGFQAQRAGRPIPDAEALPRVGRRNLSAWQKGWCLAEREGADVL